jgi:hypothetical protein
MRAQEIVQMYTRRLQKKEAVKRAKISAKAYLTTGSPEDVLANLSRLKWVVDGRIKPGGQKRPRQARSIGLRIQLRTRRQYAKRYRGRQI